MGPFDGAAKLSNKKKKGSGGLEWKEKEWD